MELGIVTAFIVVAILSSFGGIEASGDVCGHYSGNPIKFSVQSKAGDDGNWTTVFTAIGDREQPKEGWVVDVNHDFVNVEGKEMIKIEGLLKRGPMEQMSSDEPHSSNCDDVIKHQNEELKKQLNEAIKNIDHLRHDMRDIAGRHSQEMHEIKHFFDRCNNEQNTTTNLCNLRDGSLKFNKIAGSNIVVSEDGKKVTRKNLSTASYAFAYSNRPLHDCDFVEFTLLQTKENMSGRVVFGVVLKSPVEMDNPQRPDKDDERILGYNNQGFRGEHMIQLQNTTVGDLYAVQKTKYGHVHYYYNGNHLGTASRLINDTENVYAFIYLWVNALEVGIN